MVLITSLGNSGLLWIGLAVGMLFFKKYRKCAISIGIALVFKELLGNRIAEKIPVDIFYLPDYDGDADKSGDLLKYIEKKDLKSVRVDEQQKIALGDAEIEVDPALIQYDQQEKNDNDASLIVKIFYKEDEWLLPGDIEKDAIEIWLGENTQTFDILKMPHHGGREKNTKELLDNTEPEIAVITDSVLEEVPEKVLKQLEKRDITVYRSSVNCTITITGDGTGTYDVTSEK
jgi:competence protein ComEC